MVLFLEMEMAKCQAMCGWNRNKERAPMETNLCCCQGAGLLSSFYVITSCTLCFSIAIRSWCLDIMPMAIHLISWKVLYQHSSMGLLWKYLISIIMQGSDLQEWKQVQNLRSNCLWHEHCKGLQVDHLQIVRVIFAMCKYHLIILVPWFLKHFHDSCNP